MVSFKGLVFDTTGRGVLGQGSSSGSTVGSSDTVDLLPDTQMNVTPLRPLEGLLPGHWMSQSLGKQIDSGLSLREAGIKSQGCFKSIAKIKVFRPNLGGIDDMSLARMMVRLHSSLTVPRGVEATHSAISGFPAVQTVVSPAGSLGLQGCLWLGGTGVKYMALSRISGSTQIFAKMSTYILWLECVYYQTTFFSLGLVIFSLETSYNHKILIIL